MKPPLHALASSLKEWAETATGCRIYRNSIPQGADLSADIARSFGIQNIRTVFDVGANVGQSALAYLKLFPAATIYSFEPVASSYAELQTAVRGQQRVRPFRLAMGSREGVAQIHLTSDSRKSSIDHVRDSARTEQIEVSTMGNFTAKENIAQVDFLKIDTEGHELEVLKGATSLLREQRVRLLMLECEPVATGAAFTPFPALAEFLREFDYRVFGIYEQQLDWEGSRHIQYFNAVFVAGRVAQGGFQRG